MWLEGVDVRTQKKSVGSFQLCGLLVLLLSLVGLGCASSGTGPAMSAEPPPPPPVVGTWNLTIETPVGTQTPTFTVTGTADALMGSVSGDQGTLDVEDLTFDNGALGFVFEIDAGGQQLRLVFTGTVDGDSLTGSFSSDFGDMAVTGTRAP